MVIRIFWVALFLVGQTTAYFLPAGIAAEPAPQAAGYAFRLSAGAGYMASKDQLRPNDGNKRPGSGRQRQPL